jgi:hypothetical protein
MILKNKTLNQEVTIPYVLRVKPENEMDFLKWLLVPQDGAVHPSIQYWEINHEYEFIEHYDGERLPG